MLDPRFPFSWFWLADDGRIYSALAGTVVDKTDAGYVAFVASGASATRWPPDETGAQTTASLQQVLTPYGLYADLASLHAGLCADIDHQAEAQRLKYVTDGSTKAMVYLQKQAQATAALNGLKANPPVTADQAAAAYLLLAAEIGITVDPTTGKPASDAFGVARAVAAVVAVWLPMAAKIEGACAAAKAAIGAAATVDAARAAHAAVAWPVAS